MINEEKELKVKRYLLDGYVCGEKKVIQVDGKEYEIQKYQGEHQNEYLISEMKDGKIEGRCELFENGILSLSWVMKDGKQMEITEYEKGKALFKEEWDGVLGEGNHRLVENSRDELVLVIRNSDNTMIYRGGFDEELNRCGIGVEYDENGELKYEGYWNRDKIKMIIKEFRGDEMIEYDDWDSGNVLNRIPLYIGGYSIVDDLITRNGKGYLIDKNGIAMRESEWSNGKEVKGTDLYNGWYVKGMKKGIRYMLNIEHPEREVDCMQIEIHNSVELNELCMSVTNLVVSSNSCNELKILYLNGYKCLKSIEIGDNCFGSVVVFKVNGLKYLISLKIGMNSFTRYKNSNGNDSSRSFSILNCDKLESIEIGQYSFSDYGGGFELRNLPKLSTIKIGEIGTVSRNFFYSSFEIKDLPNLYSFELGDRVFEESLSTIISNLPNLNSIKLGDGALWGRNDSSCSLKMENLSDLISITSNGNSFQYYRSVTLSNIPYLETVNLPNSFQSVYFKSITNVSPILASLVKIKSGKYR